MINFNVHEDEISDIHYSLRIWQQLLLYQRNVVMLYTFIWFHQWIMSNYFLESLIEILIQMPDSFILMPREAYNI